MSKKPETRFWESQVKPRLEQIPNLYFRKIQQVAIRGLPDVFICYRGRMFAFEMKVRPNKLKVGSLQWYNLEEIKQAGGYATELTPENLDQVLKELQCFNGFLNEEKNQPK